MRSTATESRLVYMTNDQNYRSEWKSFYTEKKYIYITWICCCHQREGNGFSIIKIRTNVVNVCGPREIPQLELFNFRRGRVQNRFNDK